jgi:hypothetical protein
VVNNNLNVQPTQVPLENSTTTYPETITNPTPLPSPTNFGPVLLSKSGLVKWTNPVALNQKLFGSEGNDSDYGGDTLFSVGKFVSGKYKDSDLLIDFLGYGMGGYNKYYIVRIGNTYTILDKYSDDLLDTKYTKQLVKFAHDTEFTLPDIDMPSTLHSENPKADYSLVYSLGFFKNGYNFFYSDYRVKAFTDSSAGDVYLDNYPGTENYNAKNGFYVKSPDGLEYTYQLNIGLMGTNKVPAVAWIGGKQNSGEYVYQAIGGCGASNFRDIANVKLEDLTQVGVTNFGGQAIYGYKDSHAEELQNIYDSMYVPEGETKISYNTFISSHPIFFWKDPFGKFIRFKSTKYQPMAECGKPVIYLYPETTQKVSVKVSPVGGFTFTEPAYNQGWNVISDPVSNITNLADGKVYPYLFWEGRGGMYQTPDRGFVVAQADAHNFLLEKLAKLGLNTKESADFMEYWEPKMQGSPYYFVTFMGNSTMDALAPLEVSPKPDTVIRILMDFVPLEKPIAVQGFNIRTPERKGFTVVEWGGVRRN